MNSLKINIVKSFILFLVISLAGLSAIYGYQRIITFGFIPLLLLISLSLNRYTFNSFKNIYSRYFLGLIALSILLILISINLETAFQNVISLLGVYLTILLTIELLNYKRLLFLEIFLLSFVIAFLMLAGYVFFVVGKNKILLDAVYIDRSQFDLNANTYSYFSFFANIALFYLIQVTPRKIYIFLSFACLVLGVYISFVTVSRSGMVFTLLIGSAYWLFIFNKVRINPVVRFLIVLLVTTYGLIYVYGIYSNSFLKLRVDTYTESRDPRQRLAEEAINVFMDHPFTGVGPGQFYLYAFNRSSFSHNSYTEIAANMGIVGIILIVALFFKPLIRELGSGGRKKFDISLKKLNILFFTAFILINNIYVFYLTTYGMMFFFIVLVIQKNKASFRQFDE